MPSRSLSSRLFGLAAGALAMAACARGPHAAPAPVPTPTRPPAEAIRSGAALLAAMHARYAGRWYSTLTFRQTTTIYRPGGGEFVQAWHEALRVPGALRIETDTVGGGFLFRGDSIYTFVNGRLAHVDTGRNELLVLGFDLYGQPTARSERVLRALGFDLSKLHETTWDGTPVYVVGALAGDTVSRQFWVRKDDLLFVRTLQTQERGGTRIHRDVRFAHYEPVGGGWVATEVVAYTNGRRALTERYADVRVDVPLPDAVFEPARWSETRRLLR